MKKIAAMILLVTGVIAVKWCFADADAARLDWLLRPASFLVSFCSGISFIPIKDFGYLSTEAAILIAPACSGLNFFSF
jgi:exosortase K